MSVVLHEAEKAAANTTLETKRDPRLDQPISGSVYIGLVPFGTRIDSLKTRHVWTFNSDPCIKQSQTNVRQTIHLDGFVDQNLEFMVDAISFLLLVGNAIEDYAGTTCLDGKIHPTTIQLL